jgi:hypothetical protein
MRGVEGKNPKEVTSEIPVYRINGFVESDTVSDDMKILGENLEQLGLNTGQFGYRAIHPRDVEVVLEYGTDRDDDLVDLYEIEHDLLLEMEEVRSGDEKAVVVVYDKTFLSDEPKYQEFDEDDSGDLVRHPEYAFKDPTNKRTAVAAVVIAEDFGVID